MSSISSTVVKYVSDIDRSAVYRRQDVSYGPLTREVLAQPRVLVRRVHDALVLRGYDGPAPDFGSGWDALFTRLSRVVPRRRRPLRAAS